MLDKRRYIPYNKTLTEKARENRKNPTPAEKKLYINTEVLNNIEGVYQDLRERISEIKPPKSPLSGGLPEDILSR